MKLDIIFKTIKRTSYFISAYLMFAINSANAAFIPTGDDLVELRIDDISGELLGAINIDVFNNGDLYDVFFKDGTVNSAMGGVDFLDAENQTEATSFSQALLDYVLIDFGTYLFDSLPVTIFGCDNEEECRVVTPFMIDAANSHSIVARNIHNGNIDSLGGSAFDLTTDFTNFSDLVWADWQPSPTQHTITPTDVPEPAPIAVILLGLGALVARRYPFSD